MTTVTYRPVPLPPPEAERSIAGFADQLFTHLPRADQRRWAAAYLIGLLAVSGRKSVRSLAAAVTDSPTASQSLHRFVNSSPWEWRPARTELTRWVDQRLRPTAWTVGTAVVPKRGDQSCGVHRRFVPALGRTINCQVGVGLFLASARCQVPVDWRLHLPGEWADDRLRRRTRIPDGVQPVPSWAQVLDLADTLASVNPSPLPLVADLGEHKDPDRLLQGLRHRRHDFVVAVPGALPVVPPADPAPGGAGGSGRTGGALAPTAPRLMDARRFLDAHGEVLRSVCAKRLGGRTGPTQVVTGLVRLPGASPAPRFYRLFAERPRTGRAAPTLWLTSLAHRSMEELLELIELRHGTPPALRRLAGDFGLQDFEGRSYPGWHRHVTLVSAACAYSRLAGAESGTEPYEPSPAVPLPWRHNVRRGQLGHRSPVGLPV